LEARKNAWGDSRALTSERKSLSYAYLQNVFLLELKRKHEWLRMVPSQTLQVAIQNLERAYVNFFKNQAGFPKFKTKFSRSSFCIPQLRPGFFPRFFSQIFFPDFFQRKEGFADTMRIPKMDSPLRYRNHRHPPEGAVAKQAWVCLEPSGDCFVSILFQKKRALWWL
jgi:putative transposase